MALYEETLCDHGNLDDHYLCEHVEGFDEMEHSDEVCLCPGGSRREVIDLVAAVRVGVESGTIEGMEIEWCKTHRQSAPPCGARMNCNIIAVLVVRIEGET